MIKMDFWCVIQSLGFLLQRNFKPLLSCDAEGALKSVYVWNQ